MGNRLERLLPRSCCDAPPPPSHRPFPRERSERWLSHSLGRGQRLVSSQNVPNPKQRSTQQGRLHCGAVGSPGPSMSGICGRCGQMTRYHHSRPGILKLGDLHRLFARCPRIDDTSKIAARNPRHHTYSDLCFVYVTFGQYFPGQIPYFVCMVKGPSKPPHANSCAKEVAARAND